MLDRLTEIFCQIDDFCKSFEAHCKEAQIGHMSGTRGPEPGLSTSEIITLLLIQHGTTQFRYLKTFYNLFAKQYLKKDFPNMPCYERFIATQKNAFMPLVFFLLSKLGQKTGIYYIDSTSLPVCDNHRIRRHKTFKGIAERGKTSMGWFFGLKLHLIFNDLNEIVAFKITSGNVHDTQPVPFLTKDLVGKLFGDKGYIGKKLAETLLRRGLTLFTRARKNMKSVPLAMSDKILLNARNMAETIIGHIKEFSSLNIPKHRSPMNAFLHIIVAVTAYQIDPIKPKNRIKIGNQILISP